MDHSRRAYRSLLPLLCLAQLWACSCKSDIGGGGGGTADADVGDLADADLTVIELETGIGVSFSLSPGIDVGFDHDGASVELEQVHLDITDLRLIGDAATGDERTNKELIIVRWDEDNPDDLLVVYEAAPPGMYSYIRGTVKKVKLKSEVSGSGVGDFTLELEEEFQNGTFELAIDQSLEAGTPVLIEISVDIESVLSVLDFDTLDVVEDKVVLESGDALDDIISALPGALSIESVN